MTNTVPIGTTMDMRHMFGMWGQTPSSSQAGLHPSVVAVWYMLLFGNSGRVRPAPLVIEGTCVHIDEDRINAAADTAAGISLLSRQGQVDAAQIVRLGHAQVAQFQQVADHSRARAHVGRFTNPVPMQYPLYAQMPPEFLQLQGGQEVDRRALAGNQALRDGSQCQADWDYRLRAMMAANQRLVGACDLGTQMLDDLRPSFMTAHPGWQPVAFPTWWTNLLGETPASQWRDALQSEEFVRYAATHAMPDPGSLPQVINGCNRVGAW